MGEHRNSVVVGQRIDAPQWQHRYPSGVKLRTLKDAGSPQAHTGLDVSSVDCMMPVVTLAACRFDTLFCNSSKRFLDRRFIKKWSKNRPSRKRHVSLSLNFSYRKYSTKQYLRSISKRTSRILRSRQVSKKQKGQKKKRRERERERERGAASVVGEFYSDAKRTSLHARARH